MARKREVDETPDALIVWNVEESCYQTICAHCTSSKLHYGAVEGAVWRWITDHLNLAHALRRVYVDRFDHSTEAATQLALPIVLAGKERAERRARANVRKVSDHA